MNDIDKKMIDTWLREGLITNLQAEKMYADITRERKQTFSDKLIVSLSVIGAVVMGIGALLFIASNWTVLPKFSKILLLSSVTLAAYISGYILRYKRRTLPRAGAALLFLGALLFGASVFLIAQIYHVSANNHLLLLIWLIGVLPGVYAFSSTPMAWLSALIVALWIGFFASQHGYFFSDSAQRFSLLYLVSGLLLFNIGHLHSFAKRFMHVGRVYAIVGMNIFMAALFVLTWRAVLEYNHLHATLQDPQVPLVYTLIILICASLVLALAALNWYNFSKNETKKIYLFISLSVIPGLVFHFFDMGVSIPVLFFNLLFVLTALALIFIGLRNQDMSTQRSGVFWLVVIIAAKYFDFFWDLMPRSLFFIAAGLLLLLLGIFYEKKLKGISTPHVIDPVEMQKASKRFYLLGLLICLILGLFITVKEHILRTGTKIVLETRPVDPRDLFRGDYVILAYDISLIDPKDFPELDQKGISFAQGDSLYVLFSEQHGVVKPESISDAPTRNRTYLRGTVARVHSDGKIEVRYGIENYFVPEKTGKQIEAIQNDRLHAVIAIDSKGSAVIESLLVDGNAIKF